MTDIRLGLVDSTSRTKPPVVQFTGGFWRIWTSYDQTLTHGTYIMLLQDGEMVRITINPDNSRDVTTL